MGQNTVDLVAVNSRSDLRTFGQVCAGLGLPTDGFVSLEALLRARGLFGAAPLQDGTA